jgi:hypothetical protein
MSGRMVVWQGVAMTFLKVSLGPTMPNPSMPCGWATPEIAVLEVAIRGGMGVWQGLAMDSLKFHHGSPCPTFLRHVGGQPLKRPSSNPLDTPRRTPMSGRKDGGKEDAKN